jgi:hypothetical protein
MEGFRALDDDIRNKAQLDAPVVAKQLKDGWTDTKIRKKATKTKRRGRLDDADDDMTPQTFCAVYGDEQFIKKVCM